MMTLVERLRAVRIKRPVPRTIFTIDEDHPLHLEAAAEIERLEKALEAAREALRLIAEDEEPHTAENQTRLCCKFQDIAIRTLSQKKEG